MLSCKLSVCYSPLYCYTASACFKINNLFFPSRFWHQSFPPPTLPISSYNPHNTAAHFLCSGLAVSEDECCNKSVNLSRIFNSQKISTVGVTKYPTFLQRPVAPTLLFPISACLVSLPLSLAFPVLAWPSWTRYHYETDWLVDCYKLLIITRRQIYRSHYFGQKIIKQNDSIK